MKKNILAENMRRFGTKNINEVETSTLTGDDLKTYDYIIKAIADKLVITTDEIDDFTDQVDKQYYLREFKKIITSINELTNDIQQEMGNQAG